MPTARVLDVADELCDARELLSAAKEYLCKEKFLARAQEYMEREKEAISIWWYEVALIPGLLQTAAYARKLISDRLPPQDEETVEERVATRMDRQTILITPKPPVACCFVLYEAALRSPLVDKEQLERLLEVGRLRNVVIQVLPFERVFSNALEGPMVLIETRDRERYAFAEGAFASELSADPGAVGRVTEVLSMIRTRALDPEESARFILGGVHRRSSARSLSPGLRASPWFSGLV